ncbi:hypothetical protein Y032_0412g989 [Ancylostoma ceylanicum]|uniref:Uncharacterized protein n=1 Tax=Ancylostoma ceylanicum TaxID=53326 RepID=A0A016X386_9BILA|nr:hypothetical protein Y032_0412g989 [Ancylostoma ceylanicum]
MKRTRGRKRVRMSCASDATSPILERIETSFARIQYKLPYIGSRSAVCFPTGATGRHGILEQGTKHCSIACLIR